MAETPTASSRTHHPRLLWAGLVWLVLISSWMLFYRLGAPDLRGDEALWASFLEVMTPANAWMGLKSNLMPPERPPLHLWLSYATRPLIADSESVIRFWSATSGVATVALTIRLGASTFGTPTALLAGLLLLLQGGWIFDLSHGARSGVPDPLITFFLLAAAISVERGLGNPGSRKGPWLAAGAALAGIGMVKPLLLPPALGLLAIYVLLFGGGVSRAGRLKGLLWSAGTCLALILPWNLAMAYRFGAPRFFESCYLYHLSRQIEGVPEHLEGPLFYLREISLPLGVFSLYLPAMILAAVMTFRGPNRRAWGMTAIFGIGWVGFFSLFVNKRLWYVYPVYPFVALAIAAGLSWVAVNLASRLRWIPGPRALRALGLLTLGLFGSYLALRTGDAVTTREFWFDMPWRLHRGLSSSPADKATLVRYQFHERDGPPTYGFYDRRMTDALSVQAPRRLRKIISRAAADGTELVVVSPADAAPLDEETIRILEAAGGEIQTRYGFRVLLLRVPFGPLLLRGGVPDWNNVRAWHPPRTGI